MAFAAQNFESWRTKLFLAPRIVMRERRTGSNSTNVDEREMPIKVTYWPDMPRWVIAWRRKMITMGLGNVLVPCHAGDRRGIIGSEAEVTSSLGHDFFDTINEFNYDVQGIIHAGEPPFDDSVRVIATPTAGLGVYSHPDQVITDGSAFEIKVGLGEIKPPWVLKTAGALAFTARLPFNHLGNEFVALVNQDDAQKNVAKGLVQLYSDLLTDGLSLGFLATTEVFFFCLINPLDRTEFQIFPLLVDRSDLPRNGALSPFTVQEGLATFAYMGKKPIFSAPRPRPNGLSLWSNLTLRVRSDTNLRRGL